MRSADGAGSAGSRWNELGLAGVGLQRGGPPPGTWPAAGGRPRRSAGRRPASQRRPCPPACRGSRDGSGLEQRHHHHPPVHLRVPCPGLHAIHSCRSAATTGLIASRAGRRMLAASGSGAEGVCRGAGGTASLPRLPHRSRQSWLSTKSMYDQAMPSRAYSSCSPCGEESRARAKLASGGTVEWHCPRDGDGCDRLVRRKAGQPRARSLSRQHPHTWSGFEALTPQTSPP